MMTSEELLDEIKAAFLSCKPIRRLFWMQQEGVDFACVITALAIHRGVVSSNDPDLAEDAAANNCLEWASQVFGEDFVWGVISAWDGQVKVKDDPNYLRGYAVGLEAVTLLCPCDPPP